MSSLDWFAEPFQPYGSFAGEGARRVLGKPRLNPLTVLVRETVQNSWDARRADADVVEFALDGWTLSAAQRAVLRDKVFAGLPLQGLSLAEVLGRERICVLAISDRGTVGLGGPVRADLPASGRSEFVNLVFNMGQPREVKGGGGTYGFGKTITYLVSQASTVVIYSRAKIDGEVESRLIGVAVGHQYEAEGRLFTGRHWWGRRVSEGIEPLRNTEADRIAEWLGIPRFEGEETGLSVVVVAPDFGGRSDREAMTYMAGALTWNFWPKMIPDSGSGKAPMAFRVSWENEPLNVPDPEEYPPLIAYARALRAIHAFEDGAVVDPTVDVVPIRPHSRQRQLGLLAIAQVPCMPRIARAEGEDDDGGSAAISGASHHVALMRRVELVVRYLAGPELPSASVEWAGVFLSDADIDDAFASSEPPTHDDWIPSMVSDRQQKSLVNLALNYIDSELSARFAPVRPRPAPEKSPSGVVIGNALSSLVASQPGTGTGKVLSHSSGTVTPPEGATGGGDDRSPSAGAQAGGRTAPPDVLHVRAWPVQLEDGPGVEAEVVIARGDRARVSASVEVLVDEGVPEREPPVGAASPRIIGWRRVDEAETLVSGNVLTLEPTDQRKWILSRVLKSSLGDIAQSCDQLV